MKIPNRIKRRTQSKVNLPQDNFSVARFVNEGNPDNQIKDAQREAGENTEIPIPDGDRK